MRRSPFHRTVVTTTVLTYMLIAVGGLVRASGAGLGCPDWPRCFGGWIPPASAAELPPQFDAAQFNPALMWTEYLNRLLGVMVGFAMLTTAVAAWRWHRRNPRVVGPALAALLLTGFQGWLGGRVVAHELAAWIVTAHLLVALMIVALLIWATIESAVDGEPASRGEPARRALGWWTWGVVGLFLVEVTLGTQVRERVDEAFALVSRDRALAAVGTLALVHEVMAVVVVTAVAALWIRVRTRHARDRVLMRASGAALACTIGQVLAGAVLTSLALPPAAQVLHLTLASLLLGALAATALVAWRWPPTAPAT